MGARLQVLLWQHCWKRLKTSDCLTAKLLELQVYREAKGKRELIVQNGGDGAADRVISTGGAAGGKNDTGFLRRGIAVIRCRAIVVGLPATGSEGEDHQHGKHKSEKLFHAQTPYIC